MRLRKVSPKRCSYLQVMYTTVIELKFHIDTPQNSFLRKEIPVPKADHFSIHSLTFCHVPQKDTESD